MRLFFLVLMLFSLKAYSSPNCYKVNTRSSNLNIRSSAWGQICGSKAKGESLFPDGACRGGWCPVSFTKGACKGIGWVKEVSSGGRKFIKPCGDDPENIMSLPDSQVRQFRNRGNCYRVKSERSLAIRTSPDGRSCDYVRKGRVLTPKGACQGKWCPVEFLKGKCKGTGWVSRGRFHNKYIEPCNVEVSSDSTRANAGVVRSRPGQRSGGQSRVGEASELVGGEAERVERSYRKVPVQTANGFGSSLPFRKRCHSSSCKKAARRGYNINQYNGCEGNMTLGKSGGRCDSTIYMNENLKEALNKNLTSCVNSTARALGIGSVSKIHINQMGCFHYRTKRGGKSLSEHGKGSAIDIGSLELTMSNGSQRTISMHKKDYKKDGQFYDKFYECWNEMGGSCSCGIRHNAGSKRMRKLHRDHIHLTYNCKRKSGC